MMCLDVRINRALFKFLMEKNQFIKKKKWKRKLKKKKLYKKVFIKKEMK